VSRQNAQFHFCDEACNIGKKIKSGCLLCNPKAKAPLSYKTVSVEAEFLISGSAMGKMPNLALKTFQKQN